MNEKGVIYPFTTIFVVMIFVVTISFLGLYQTETQLIKEMKQIELLQSLLGITTLMIKEEGGLVEDSTFRFNEGYVVVKIKEKLGDRIRLNFQAFTLTGATYSWELWYDKTNTKWTNK